MANIKLKQLLKEARFKLSKEDLKHIKKSFVPDLQSELKGYANSYVEDNDLDDSDYKDIMKYVNNKRKVFDYIEDWMEQDKSTVEDIEAAWDGNDTWEELVTDAKDSFGMAS